jgi:diguanylate cyclase (GGDEF)-like protein
MRSLRLKVLALASALVVLSQAGTVTSVLVTANRAVADRAEQKLATGSRVLDEIVQSRALQLGSTVSVLAADFAFKQAVASADRATIESALANHAFRARADIAILSDDSDQLVTSLPGDRTVGHVIATELLDPVEQDGTVHWTYQSDTAAYEMLTVPVLAPLPIAWVTMGFQIDDDFARRIGALTSLDITVVSTRPPRPRVIASAMSGQARGDLVSAALQSGDGPSRITAGGTEYLFLKRPFMVGAKDIVVLVLESQDEAMAPYRMLRATAVILGAFLLLCALAGAVLLSRTLTRPVQRLVGAARRIRMGNYREPVAVDSGDELAELALAFNGMQEDISAREERISYQARYDQLTGLPNRQFALEQLDEALCAASGTGLPVSLLVIDLGGMTEITATFGHDIGDSYVAEAAQRLRAGLRAGDSLGRIEGDRFLWMVPGTGAEQGRELARSLVKSLDGHLQVRQINVHVQPVIGIASFPEHGAQAEQLLLRAEVARSRAAATPGRIEVYATGSEEQRVRQFALLGDLVRAVRQDELRMHLQPKVSLADGTIIGAEALVRWSHPTLGWIPPAEFIPLAERSGNIGLVTRWALIAAVRECRFWVEDGREWSVAVNISGRDLRERRFPDLVAGILRDHDLDPRHLTLEITEEALLDDFDEAVRILKRLRDTGVRIAIDDFGTGSSSLAKLKHLPVDELKVDRSFTLGLPDSLPDAALVTATIELGHKLNLRIVAEGVENRASLRWLREHGCEYAQGYLVSRPMPAEDFQEWVRAYEAEGSLAAPTVMVRALL